MARAIDTVCPLVHVVGRVAGSVSEGELAAGVCGQLAAGVCGQLAAGVEGGWQ